MTKRPRMCRPLTYEILRPKCPRMYTLDDFNYNQVRSATPWPALRTVQGRTLQMKGQEESKINVWFRSMYSQKWNRAALLFLKQNYNVLSPNIHFHVSLSDLYIPGLGSWEYINRSQIRECWNWERGRAVWFLGLHNWDFRYSASGTECSLIARGRACIIAAKLLSRGISSW